MDAKIYHFKPAATPFNHDLLHATRSVTEFMAWYSGALLTFHVALVHAAVSTLCCGARRD